MEKAREVPDPLPTKNGQKTPKKPEPLETTAENPQGILGRGGTDGEAKIIFPTRKWVPEKKKKGGRSWGNRKEEGGQTTWAKGASKGQKGKAGGVMRGNAGLRVGSHRVPNWKVGRVSRENCVHTGVEGGAPKSKSVLTRGAGDLGKGPALLSWSGKGGGRKGRTR